MRLNGRTVEIFIKGERVGNGKHMTAADHMPSKPPRAADVGMEDRRAIRGARRHINNKRIAVARYCQRNCGETRPTD